MVNRVDFSFDKTLAETSGKKYVKDEKDGNKNYKCIWNEPVMMQNMSDNIEGFYIEKVTNSNKSLDDLPKSVVPPTVNKQPPCLKLSMAKYYNATTENASQVLEQPDGTKIMYDANGYIVGEYDKNGRQTKSIEYDYHNSAIISSIDGDYQEDNINTVTISRFLEASYDEKGNMTRYALRNELGELIKFFDHQYDENGDHVQTIERLPNGSINSFMRVEKTGANEVRYIKYNADGSVAQYVDAKCDEDGSIISQTRRDAEGKVLSDD